jgi:hypothetical protein
MNVFFDEQGFPNKTKDYNNRFHNIDGGVILQRKKYAVPKLDAVDPLFNYEFDETLHGAQLAKELDVSHLLPDQASRLTDLIKHYWTVFNLRGTFTPVKFYQCDIDTGNHKPIAIKKIIYGPKETGIMQKSIAALEKVGHICQIHNGQWLFKALLAAKPHQEHVSIIKDFVWQFCINYIPLNQITRQTA